jgi:hypothetical protein
VNWALLFPLYSSLDERNRVLCNFCENTQGEGDFVRVCIDFIVAHQSRLSHVSGTSFICSAVIMHSRQNTEHSSNNSASAIEWSGWLFWVDNLTANRLRERLCLVGWEIWSRKELCQF